MSIKKEYLVISREKMFCLELLCCQVFSVSSRSSPLPPQGPRSYIAVHWGRMVSYEETRNDGPVILQIPKTHM